MVLVAGRESVVLSRAFLFIQHNTTLSLLRFRKVLNVYLTKGRAVIWNLSKANFSCCAGPKLHGGQAAGCFANHILLHTVPTQSPRFEVC